MKKIIIGFFCILIGLGVVLFLDDDYFKGKEKKEEKVVKKEVKKYSGVFGDKMGKAIKLRKSMSLDEKIGQVFLVRYDENTNDVELSKYHPSGYIMYAKDFEEENPDSFKKKIDSMNDSSDVDLAIAVDEEGGVVNRVSKYPNFRSEVFPSNQSLYNEGGIDKVLEVEKEKTNLLKSIGININLAPVADVSVNPDDFIYERSLGKGADETSVYIREVVKTMRENGISGCLKHFPGYGNNSDTHTGIAIDNRDYNNFVESDFKPFKAGIDESVPIILVSHNIVNSMDSKYPASLSVNVHKILRDDLDFSGLIVTDDLAMGAIKEYTKGESPVVVALEAGNDLIMTSSFIDDFKIIKDEISSDKKLEKLLNKAVDRVLAWKYTYNII